METKEFKLFYKNKSPLLFTYLLNIVISSKVAEDLLLYIFAKYYRTKNHRPVTISKERWLLLISKKVVLDYLNWRTTEEGQQMENPGLGSYDASVLATKYQSQLTEWVNDFSEEEQAIVNSSIMTELPPPDLKVSVKEQIKNKLQVIGEKYGARKK